MIMIEMNCRASASVKSEIHASSDLIREMIYQLNLRAMIATNETEKSKFMVGVSMLVRVPLILPKKKRPSQTAHGRIWKNILRVAL